MSTCTIGGACGRPWQRPCKNEFNKTGAHFGATYTVTFNPVSLYDD